MTGEDDVDASAKPDVVGVPAAPASLPPKRTRAGRRGPARTTIKVSVEVVTPILGGGAQARELDEIDVIRTAAVRGSLRFWWRALHGHEERFKNAAELYKAESDLWGRAATEKGGRSAIELRVEVQQRAKIDDSPIRMSDAGAYALWPGREERRQQRPTARRWFPGSQFRLELVVPNEKDYEAKVREVVRTWLLFGGYGSRPRRGLGSFRVLTRDREWLPSKATPEAFEDCFSRDIFSPVPPAAGDTPWLAGAVLHVGTISSNAEHAWLTALGWLKEFRQGIGGARQPGKQGRPSISNWPEADKVRRLSHPSQANRWAHTPQHNASPAWPRAGFGLPINGQFQTESREPRPGWRPGGSAPKHLRWHELPPGHGNYGDEPEPFEICWQSYDEDGRPEPQERLASPLIVKALPLADGKFVPCALWLQREYPKDGKVVLSREDGVVRGSEARFHDLVAEGERPRFFPLAGKQSLRDAFLDWLQATYKTTRIAP